MTAPAIKGRRGGLIGIVMFMKRILVLDLQTRRGANMSRGMGGLSGSHSGVGEYRSREG